MSVSVNPPAVAGTAAPATPTRLGRKTPPPANKGRCQQTAPQGRRPSPLAIILVLLLVPRCPSGTLAGGLSELPTAYLIDRSGTIRYVARGQLEWDRVDVVEIARTLADRVTGLA